MAGAIMEIDIQASGRARDLHVADCDLHMADCDLHMAHPDLHRDLVSHQGTVRRDGARRTVGRRVSKRTTITAQID